MKRIWLNHWFSTAYNIIRLIRDSDPGYMIIGTNENEESPIKAVCDGYDFVYVHLEATDEVSHAQDLALKIRVIEDFDSRIIGRVRAALGDGAAYCVLPDHPVPIHIGKHTRTPVPVSVHQPGAAPDAVEVYSEKTCPLGSLGAMKGSGLMDLLLGAKDPC